MARVSGVRLRPAPRRTLREELVAVRALLAGDAPGLYLVGEMSRVTLVIEREPLDRPVADPQRVEFVAEIPLLVTAATTHRRGVVDAVPVEAI